MTAPVYAVIRIVSNIESFYALDDTYSIAGIFTDEKTANKVKDKILSNVNRRRAKSKNPDLYCEIVKVIPVYLDSNEYIGENIEIGNSCYIK